MSSQTIWFAYDPQLAISLRTRLDKTEVANLWASENVGTIPTPHIISTTYLGNPIEKMATKVPPNSNLHYDVMRGEHQTIEALNNFLHKKSWRSCVDWTTTYLLKNPNDYHMWFIRFACLLKLNLFETIENEFETFGNLNAHINLPFYLRILHAELPIYIDSTRLHDGLDRLFRLLMITNTILSVLPKDQTQLWHKRRLRILHSIGNCYILMKRIDLVISIIENQIIKNETIEQQIELYLLVVRLLLQTGDEHNAQRAYDRALNLLPSKENRPKEFLFTEELFKLFRNEFSNATHSIHAKHPIEINNHCVTLLYTSKMKESLDLYEQLIRNQNPIIHEAIIYNMCTLYELESFRFTQKKHDLIDHICQHIGDGFNLTAFKLQT